MRIAVPREVKEQEFRVALTPAGAGELTACGHEVLIEAGAGVGSGFADIDYVAHGARTVSGPAAVWAGAELVLKVKEPVPEEYSRLRAGQVLFAYLHLAASRQCTEAILASGITAIAYETVRAADGSLPLLAPMSEVAGRLGPQVGARCRTPPPSRSPTRRCRMCGPSPNTVGGRLWPPIPNWRTASPPTRANCCRRKWPPRTGIPSRSDPYTSRVRRRQADRAACRDCG
ncbi:hypothetical protein D5S18_30560 [Nocardia panacis]|uniref:Alanine dehydrogenase/pyridine nucleotide transhydrogenase N-terminal domain-containing protein n=1 Tax=Nocardia panacis TaxID=2340916 RepID=A0A3A4KJG3_9NOCA|nr:hypothetical protein D5S18_30560 [Nocardia panacis]